MSMDYINQVAPEHGKNWIGCSDADLINACDGSPGSGCLRCTLLTAASVAPAGEQAGQEKLQRELNSAKAALTRANDRFYAAGKDLNVIYETLDRTFPNWRNLGMLKFDSAKAAIEIMASQPSMDAIKKSAEKAANEIADQFRDGFFNDEMVRNIATIIEKHTNCERQMLQALPDAPNAGPIIPVLESPSPILNVCGTDIDLRRVTHVGTVGGGPEWLCYSVYLDNWEVEIYEERCHADGHPLRQMPRAEFVRAWETFIRCSAERSQYP